MKKILSFLLSIVLLSISLSLLTTSQAYAGVTRGYFKKNGTYVSPYLRSNPDKYKFNNYSCYTKGRCY